MGGPTGDGDAGPKVAVPGPGPEFTPACSIEDAIARMTALNTTLPADDGLLHFNQMYLLVTQTVGVAVRAATFDNPDFLTLLDVEFANHYLRAVALAQSRPEAMSRCWRVIHDRRWSRHIAPLQFAVAGMNAHINHDLVLSLVSTWELLDHEPDRFYADFCQVNGLLADLEDTVRRSFERGLLLRLDQTYGAAQHHADMWSISVARGAAWHDAHLVWRVRHHQGARARYLHMLDDAVAQAGECLLLPACRHVATHRPAHNCAVKPSFLN